MKKTIIFAALIIIILNIFKTEAITIPKEAIRFRVIASSNKEEDQNFKKELVTNLLPVVATINFENKVTASTLINSKIPEIKNIIDETKSQENYSKSYEVNYGKNYFPEKEYKGIKYPAGEYESLVITLGNGLGENFWCVLFPPLCLVEAENNSTDEIEYTSFIKEIINKYF